jgi:ribose 1,5-bisphosphokinase
MAGPLLPIGRMAGGISRDPVTPIRPTARLVYVMGASGAGKDAMMQVARDRLDGTHGIVFAHRYATRPPDLRHPNEVSLGPGEFAVRAARRLFTYTWEARSIRYGIGAEVRIWTASGLVAVVSGSREHFARRLQQAADVLPVLVTASAGTRAARLRARAREPEPEILERLARGDAFKPVHPALVTIVNEGALQQAAMDLVQVLVGEAARALTP